MSHEALIKTSADTNLVNSSRKTCCGPCCHSASFELSRYTTMQFRQMLAWCGSRPSAFLYCLLQSRQSDLVLRLCLHACLLAVCHVPHGFHQESTSCRTCMWTVLFVRTQRCMSEVEYCTAMVSDKNRPHVTCL